jgi:hypothetical protein
MRTRLESVKNAFKVIKQTNIGSANQLAWRNTFTNQAMSESAPALVILTVLAS